MSKRFSFTQNYTPKAVIDITPLIDLVFLLVVFFMVSSSLGKSSSLFIDLPFADEGGDRQLSQITITVDENNEIYLNDEQTSIETLGDKITALAEEVDEETILIRGDKQTSYQTIISVMDTLRKNNISTFTLATVSTQ